MNADDLRSAFADLLSDLPADEALPPATAARITRRRRTKLAAGALGGTAAIVAVAALAVGAASPRDDRLLPAGRPTATPTATPAPAPTPTPAASASAAPVGPTPQPGEDAPADGSAVVLRPDGLAFPDGSSTSALLFGSDAATVRAALDDALGQGGEAATPDCGPASSVVQYELLFLRLQGGRFVGWTSGSPGLQTADGIGVGTTLGQLRAALPGVLVREGTLGLQWSDAGGLAGFLDGTQDDSTVNSLGAGDQCLAQ